LARLENALAQAMNHRWLALALLAFSLSVGADQAVVITEGAVVFVKPDFDSEAMMQLHAGDSVEVSKRVFGPFHRVRVKNGKMGFLADNDYVVRGSKMEKAWLEAQKKDATLGSQSESEPDQKPKRIKPFALTRYRGVSFNEVSYREDTMALKPTANILFIGFKAVGPNLLVDGDFVTEVNADLYPSAPYFYQEATGNSASGWILHTDMLFESIFPQSKSFLAYIGFGPMFKYSHYVLNLTNSVGGQVAYPADDMTLGLVFAAGVGWRLGSFGALRAEYKFYWEKMQYGGVGLSLLFPF